MRNASTINQAPFVSVKLRGHLADEVTNEVMRIRAWSPSAAIRIIQCNYPSFNESVVAANSRGLGYRVFVGDIPIEDEQRLDEPVGGPFIGIAPVPIGSGGAGKVLLGATLIGASFFSGGTLSSLALTIGMAVGAQGASQLISPQPGTPNTEEERKRSALFDSAGGAAEDGDPVFLHYGEGWLSGKVLSQSLNTFDI